MRFGFVKKRLELKRAVRKYGFLMQNGLWRVEARYLYRPGGGAGNFARFFEAYHRPGSPAPPSPRERARGWVRKVLGLDRMVILGRGKAARASAVYVARTHGLKFFDYRAGEILTTTTHADWRSYCACKRLALFRYFDTPDAALIDSPAGPLRRETLVSAPPLVLLEPQTRLEAVERIFAAYLRYIAEHREPPRPTLQADTPS